jgi:hypothetical protein
VFRLATGASCFQEGITRVLPATNVGQQGPEREEIGVAPQVFSWAVRFSARGPRTHNDEARHLTRLIDCLIKGARNIERQRVLVRDLERDELDSREALRALKQALLRLPTNAFRFVEGGLWEPPQAANLRERPSLCLPVIP